MVHWRTGVETSHSRSASEAQPARGPLIGWFKTGVLAGTLAAVWPARMGFNGWLALCTEAVRGWWQTHEGPQLPPAPK